MILKKVFDLEKEHNLILDDSHIENIKEGNKKYKLLRGEIIQANGRCVKCNSKNISKNGIYIKTVRLTKLNDSQVKIILSVQRYTCNCEDCGINFTPEVSFIEKKKRISKQIHKQVFIDMITPISSKQVARQNNVSINVVQRDMKEFKSYNIVNKRDLPRVLCVDEFKGVKHHKAKMNFIIVDAEKRTVKDILANRFKNSLISYFNGYTLEARENVEYFVTDFYDSYIDIAEKTFPNAKIVIDRFHIKRLLVVNLKNKRIEIMKKFSKHHFPYKVLKKFRYLLYKNFYEINIKYKKYRYYEEFKNEYDVLNYMLSLNKELEETYWAYQDFIEAFDSKDEKMLEEIINRDYSHVSDEVNKTFNTYKKYQEYVVNAIKYPYSNGLVEGMNTKIKLLKRTGYGYRNFQNFRLRIMIMFNLVKFVEDEQRKEKRIRDYHKKAS